MPLTEKEKEELEVLENPNVQYFYSPAGTILSWLFGKKSELKYRKKRIVELRTKMRTEELNFDPMKDREKYEEIKKKEEHRFDRKFIYKTNPSDFKDKEDLKKSGNAQCSICGNIQEHKLKNCQKCSNEME